MFYDGRHEQAFNMISRSESGFGVSFLVDINIMLAFYRLIIVIDAFVKILCPFSALMP